MPNYATTDCFEMSRGASKAGLKSSRNAKTWQSYFATPGPVACTLIGQDGGHEADRFRIESSKILRFGSC